MSKELVIGSNRHETKVAVLEDDQLVELYFQRANEYSLAGSIHKGRVTRVLPGMQSAFVDLGLERDTFLYVSDFFEEPFADDIDTVGDEKPMRRPQEDAPAERSAEDRGREDRGREDRGRDDRGRDRDRGGRDDRNRNRGGNRPPSDRPPVVAAPEAERFVAAPPALTSDPEVTSAPVTLAGETRAVDANARPANGNDRNRGNDDRGDRQGRRSRRRRGRGGRGIPDNKYAQPGASESAPVMPEPLEDVEVEDEEREKFHDTAPPSDVIILPGESLAKYRQRAEPAPAPAPVYVQPEPLAPEVTPEEFVHEEPVNEQEVHPEIAAEAESIELTDQVFGHHDEEPSELEEEEKIEEVRHDHAAPEAVEESIEIEATEIHEVRQERLADISWSAERRAAEELFSNVVPIREDEEVEPFQHPTYLSQTEAFEAEVDQLDSTGSIASVHDLAPEIEEALEAGDFESNPPETSEGAPTAQTASLRDQGGRYPHRSSRRMRRRRGGSRLGTEGQPAAPQSVVGEAPALESEVQAEVREPREPREAREPREQRESREPREAREPRGEAREERGERPDRSDRVMPSISDLLKAGQEIIVQIAKEPLGQKGARITSHIALPGRYVVFMPSVNHLGVSRKVSSEEERHRLKRILQAHRVGTTGGFIVRTAGEGVPEEEIAADMNFLYTLWLDIRQKAEKKPAPILLHYDLDVVQRILRDQITEDFKAIWVDNEDLYESVLTFMQRFQPALVNRVKMYTRSAPIFDAFNITQELEKALRPKVWLKSGGYLVINQTEALVAIDINTGKYVGRSNRLEDTIVKTNTEAVKEIVRQIRLRDLGGIIVVDFIDMDERKNRQKVMQALEEAMRSDKAPYKILQFNDFGLVAITRKRVKQSLERTLCAPCHYCEGAGYIKSTQTVIGEILVEAQKIAKALEGKDVMLRVHPEVAKVLKASDNKYLEELEEILGRPVLVKGDASLHSEKFDLG